MKVVDGCDGQALTQQKIIEILRGSEDKGISIGRMPGIEADALSAWVRLGRDTDKLVSTEKDAVFRLQQNTGFYAEPDQFKSVLDAWCNIYLESLRSSDLLYRLETDYAARNDFLVADALKEIHVWSATRLHQWIPLLEGKKELVVTPFKDSVLNQWSKREGLFLTGHIPFKYPKFELEVIQAHNTIFGNKPYRYIIHRLLVCRDPNKRSNKKNGVFKRRFNCWRKIATHYNRYPKNKIYYSWLYALLINSSWYLISKYC